MAKFQIFFTLTLCFLLGAFLASFFQIEKYMILILIASGILLFIVNYKNKKMVVAGGAILFLALGVWRTNNSLENVKKSLSGAKIGPAEFTGTVSKEPEIDEKYQKIIVEDEEKNEILINSDVYPKYKYGDQLKISCVLEKPKNYTESNFNYPMYLAKDGIYRICNRAEISLLRSNGGNAFYSFVLFLKNKFEEKISAVFPDPEGAYLKGLLLGGSKRMTRDLSEAFQKTGTTHAVAVSGYNVTIVAAFLMWIGIWLGLWRQQVFSFALIGIIFFVLMTGAPSSAVRAGIMGSLVIWAMKEGRLAHSTNAILFAAASMLAINPLLLRYDAGFQLSFLATLGIVWLYPLFEKYFQRGSANIFKETLLMTMAAQIFVLPILLNSFEKLSIVSPLANLIILPVIPVIMGAGFLAGIAGLILVPLSKLIGFLPYVLLKAELYAVQLMASLPWASIEIKNFGWIQISIYYILLAMILSFYQRKNRLLAKPVTGSDSI